MQDLEFEQAPEPTGHWPSRIIAIILFIWILILSLVIHVGTWAGDQFDQPMEPLPGWATLLRAAAYSVLLLIPLLPLSLRWKQPRYRAIFRTWLYAAVFALVLSPAHFPEPLQTDRAAILQIVLALLFAMVFYALQKRSSHRSLATSDASALSPLLLSLAAPPVILLPWLVEGALGSPFDVVVNVLAALAFGFAAGLILHSFSRSAYMVGNGSERRRVLIGGVVAGTALLIMAANFGFRGMQLFLMLTLPATGWAVIALSRGRHSRLSLILFIGLTAAGPLVFFDPAEVAVVLAFALVSLLQAITRAALYAILLAWLVGSLLVFWRHRQRGENNRIVTVPRLVLVAGAWSLAAFVYFFAGHPGFYGDHHFIILRDQADVSGAAAHTDPEQRRQFVYETLVSHAETTQATLRRKLDRFGIAFTPYYLVNALEAGDGPLLRLWLTSQPEVERVLVIPNLRPVSLEMFSPSPPRPEPSGTLWNLSEIGADRVWETFGARGAGIVVGQSDSGVQWDHPELADSYRGSANDHQYHWFDPWYHTTSPVDIGGHGTHTLGTVLGNRTGVAPDATWIACANLPRNLGNPARYLDCMQFMLAPFPLDSDPFRDGDPSRGAHVLNNSWGCPALEGCDPASLRPAIAALRAAGIFVVVAAGNSGPACGTLDSPPAIYDESFSVGAIYESRLVTNFSSRGPVSVDGSARIKPDIVAPGSNILSAFPGNQYRTEEGTSMAGPHVAGVVALLWSANPALIGNIEATEQILLETASQDVVSMSSCSNQASVPNNDYGYGLVNAYAAVERALELANAR